MPGNVATITATGVPATDRANWLAAVASLPPLGKLIYDGLLAFDTWVMASKPLVHVGIDGRSGVSMSGDAVLYLNAAPNITDYALDTPWEGALAGAYSVRLPQAFAATLQPLDWIFLYSTDELTGMTPHQNGKQFPGECHQVLEILPPSGGLTTVYLRDSLRDSMQTNPRVNRRPMQSGTVVENFYCVRGGTKTTGGALIATDIANLRLFGVTIEGAGSIGINGPDAMTDQVSVRYQEDYGTPASEDDSWYGITMGAMAANFRVRGHFHNCRHATDTSGGGVTVNSVEYRCGTPWGTFTVDASGTSNPVLSTHAEGKGIIFDGCSVSTVVQSTIPGGNYGFDIRCRDVTIRNCRVYGGFATIGAQVRAKGCKIVTSEFSDCWLGIVPTFDDCLIKGNVFHRTLNAGVESGTGANRIKIIDNEFLDCARQLTDPPNSQAVIHIDFGTGHVIRGNSIRKGDNPSAVNSLDIKTLPEAAVELLGNDFTGWVNYGVQGTNAAALYALAKANNYPTASVAPGSPAGILILNQGTPIGSVTEIDFVGEGVNTAVVDERATVVVTLPTGSLAEGDSEPSGDMLRDGQYWLAAQLDAFAAKPVTYQRGPASVTVRATIGKTVFESDDGTGTIIHLQVRDYLIDTKALILSGTPTLPMAGDRIRETVGTKIFVHEVLPIANEPAWRYSDPHQAKLRIHTKLVATEDVP